MDQFNELNHALNWRYAVKRFSSETLDPSKVELLLRATELSASSFGLQPYKILLIKSKAMRRALVEYSMGQDKVLECSHLIVLAAEVKNGKQLADRYVRAFSKIRNVAIENLSGMRKQFQSAIDAMTVAERLEWAHQQAYIALGNLLTSAALLKIDTCPMGGFVREGYDKVLGLEKLGLTTTVICAIGYRHSSDSEANLAKVRLSTAQLVQRF